MSILVSLTCTAKTLFSFIERVEQLRYCPIRTRINKDKWIYYEEQDFNQNCPLRNNPTISTTPGSDRGEVRKAAMKRYGTSE
ncbi:MAG: hypothetical protein AVDCRST_MAG96-2413 [uncultured Segetibacter sp.]|uniref:Uncharacterized protein n=1 Tax=uncultured Segetibacter sp. TaxID=481133 RepID=A0A6J4T0I3_9BACT|nr:MAG: hypothetical protein AVDCRST_MAG96-2413 [uncultured Segetibacter sp.]